MISPSPLPSDSPTNAQADGMIFQSPLPCNGALLHSQSKHSILPSTSQSLPGGKSLSKPVRDTLIAVFAADDSIQTGYALAYRHQFDDHFSLGHEVIGDFDTSGEHLAYLTSTYALNHHLTLTLGAATGLSEDSPQSTFQSLLVWRF
jgi:hypothetical protein